MDTHADLSVIVLAGLACLVLIVLWFTARPKDIPGDMIKDLLRDK